MKQTGWFLNNITLCRKTVLAVTKIHLKKNFQEHSRRVFDSSSLCHLTSFLLWWYEYFLKTWVRISFVKKYLGLRDLLLKIALASLTFSPATNFSITILPSLLLATSGLYTAWTAFWTTSVSSVAQSCTTLCDSRDCSMPGLLVHHQLPEFIQTHVHWVGDAIQQSPLSFPSPPALNLSQHQGLFRWVSSSHQVKVLEFQLQH